MKRELTEREKTLANHISEKGIISEIYRTFESKTPNNAIKK